MQIIDNLQESAIAEAVVTSGTFDGVHIGHQKILKRIKDLAKDIGGKSVVVTFWPHPKFVLGNGWGDLKLLTTFEEKAQLMADNEIDYLIKIPFTREFSQLSSSEFVSEIIVKKLGTKKLVIGYDHKFGRNREGSFDYLKQHQEKFGFEIEEIPRQDVDHVGVSSTQIRSHLLTGNVGDASKLLGRNFVLSGIVVKGDQVGRKLGYPTANIYVAEEFKLIPSDGVYVVKVHLDEGSYQGMMNIGLRPTLGGIRKQIEVNIFDFDRDIYGRRLKIEFIQRLRDERKFNGKEELVNQLALDKIATLEAFRNQAS